MLHRALRVIIGLFFVNTIQAGRICPLCETSSQLPKRLNFAVSASPYKTCHGIYTEMAMKPINHPQCSSMQQMYRAVCCNDRLPSGWAQVPVPSVPIETTNSEGSEPYCRICGNDDYPGDPDKMITARYVGTYSCGSLYERGRDRLIPGFVCGPLQDRAKKDCGCGQNAPVPPANPPPAPRTTPNPTRNPTPNPTPPQTPPPTRHPTPNPTPVPTQRPTTPQPTIPPTTPTRHPTPNPTPVPTQRPTTPQPTKLPTRPSTAPRPPNATRRQYQRKKPTSDTKMDHKLTRKSKYTGLRGILGNHEPEGN